MLKPLVTLFLAVFAFVAAVPGKGQSTSSTDSNAAPHTLNVIFHGMFAFVVESNQIEVLAPQVDYHVYKAGEWGYERRLKEGTTYSLQGVQASPTMPTLDPALHLIAKSSAIDRSRSALFCSLVLPLPRSITGLRNIQTNSQRNLVKGAALLPAVARKIPLVEVFSYSVADVSKLSLGPDITWTASTSGTTLNLHVWAEPDAEPLTEDTNHFQHAFEQLVQLFPGMDVELTPAASSNPPTAPDPKPAVAGVNSWEEKTFLERSKLMFGQPKTSSSSRGTQITNCIGLFVTQ